MLDLFVINSFHAFPFQKALNTMGMSESDQEHAFQMVAAVLWLGNITFQAIGSENNVEVAQNEGELYL